MYKCSELFDLVRAKNVQDMEPEETHRDTTVVLVCHPYTASFPSLFIVKIVLRKLHTA